MHFINIFFSYYDLPEMFNMFYQHHAMFQSLTITEVIQLCPISNYQIVRRGKQDD